MKTILIALVVFSFSTFASLRGGDPTKEVANVNIHSIMVKNTKGEDVSLGDYKGKVLLIVNVASHCGFTKQYEGLETLYDKYKDQGFEILGFPCNDFGAQEPGTNEEIAAFCTSKFGVKFTLFDKVKVLGDEKIPLYASLTGDASVEPGDVKWNFEKFLIGKDGSLVARYRSKVVPLDESITSAIEKELSK